MLVQIFPPTAEAKKEIVARIPWKTEKGYVSFLRTPSNNCRGQIHVAMLNYEEAGYAGEGLYLEDAVDLLRTWRQLPDSVLHVRPKTGVDSYDAFGWQ
eukprot:4407508-Lingulodinium_polyedra.AAC.1